MDTRQTSAPNGVFLSVIVPVYNAEKTLHACVRSILTQTFEDYELLLVDDGSQDASADICKCYASEYKQVRYLHKENGGPLSARVFGAQNAVGGYISFIDADDYLADKDAFKRLYEKSSAYSCDIIQFGHLKKYNHLHRKISTVKTEQYASRNEFLKRDYPLLLCSFWNPSRLTTSTCNKIYRCSLFQNLPDSRMLDRVFWGDDLILNIMLLKNCQSALFIPDVFYVYRQFIGGTSRFSVTEMRDLDTIKRYQLKYLDAYESEDKERIQSALFSETAGWFNHYVRKSLSRQGREATKQMIEETLEYETFRQARAYFQHHPQEWEGAKLLCKGDSQAYLEKAEAEKKTKVSDRIREILKEIYYRI